MNNSRKMMGRDKGFFFSSIYIYIHTLIFELIYDLV